MLSVWVLISGCASRVTVQSQRVTQNILINGHDDDWEGQMQIIEKTGVAIGIRNDDDYLYLALSPLNRGMAMQWMTAGLTVWLDSTGGKNKRFGIHFPIGLSDLGIPPMIMMGMPGERDTKRDNPLEKMSDRLLEEVEIIGPGKYDKQRIGTKESTTLQVRLTHNPNGMFYELRIPLQNDPRNVCAINTRPGKNLGIGLETGKMERGRGMPPMGEGGLGGPRGGGRPGGSRSGGRPPEMERAEPLSVWISTTLSESLKRDRKMD